MKMIDLGLSQVLIYKQNVYKRKNKFDFLVILD